MLYVKQIINKNNNKYKKKMKTLTKITVMLMCLCITNILFGQSDSVTNDWNTFTKSGNYVIDLKATPTGIYLLEKEIVQVPYIQNADTLYGTKDSCTYLKKLSLSGNLIWSMTYARAELSYNGTVGNPFRIEVVSDGIILLCTWGTAKHSFSGQLIASTLFPQRVFDPFGFEGSGSGPDYAFVHRLNAAERSVIEYNLDTLCVLGHVTYCNSAGCFDSAYSITLMDPFGNIIGERKINRNVAMGVVYEEVEKVFYFCYIKDSIYIEKIDLKSPLIQKVFSAPLWGIDKDIRCFYKTNSGFAIISAYADTATSFIRLVSLFPGQQTPLSTSIYYQQNANLIYCLDEFISCQRKQDVFYIAAEDGQLLKWSIGANANSNTLQTKNPFLPGEKTYGSPRILSLGQKLIFVTNDSSKSSVIRIFDQNLIELTKDTLLGYAIGQFDLSCIDSSSFVFSGWRSQSTPAIVSCWTLIQQITTRISEEKVLDINVYPNPTHDYIYIENLPQKYHIFLTDITGHSIPVKESNGVIDVRNLSKGIYCVSLIGEHNTINKKIIIN